MHEKLLSTLCGSQKVNIHVTVLFILTNSSLKQHSVTFASLYSQSSCFLSSLYLYRAAVNAQSTQTTLKTAVFHAAKKIFVLC